MGRAHSARFPVLPAAVLALAVLASGFGGGARAQDAVCPDTPDATTGQIYCGGTGDDAIAIDLRKGGASVSTSVDSTSGVYGYHDGAGLLKIKVAGGNPDTASENARVQTSGASAHGILGYHTGAGGIDIDLLEGATVGTTGNNAYGIWGYHTGGGIDIDIQNSSVTTEGANAHGIYGYHTGAGSNIDILLRGATVSTEGEDAHGIYGWHRGDSGDIYIHLLEGARVRTSGDGAYGIFGRRSGTGTGTGGNIDIDLRGAAVTTEGANTYGIYGYHTGAGGRIDIDLLEGARVRTSGDGAYGIFGRHAGAGTAAGDIDIHLRGATVTTGGANTYGIFGLRAGTGAGNIRIDLEGATVRTTGDYAWGIYGTHADNTAGGDISITVRDGSTVSTSGIAAHGIYGYHQTGGGVDVEVRNAAVRASGAGSRGIWVRGGGLDAAGNRRQTVRVGSEVWGGSGHGSGIRLDGGGRVAVGPHGRVGAASGVAIEVARAGTSDSPHLDLHLALNGRLPEQVLVGRVANDDGTTAWTVNGVLMFDSAAGGVQDVRVPNGAWDVWATGADLSTLEFNRVFAPRAAVYEALLGVLLRLDRAGGLGGEGRLRSPGTPAWARIAGAVGSYEPDSASAGADYDFDRYSLETGLDFPLWEGLFGGELTGWAGVRAVSGSADVSAPTGGGRIEAAGYGLVAGLAWEGKGDWYGKGRLSLTRYSADLFSAERGGLKSGVSGTVHALGLEGGRRFDLDLGLGVKTRLTARGVLRGAGASLDRFEDGLFSRVSTGEADRLAAGAGVAVETGLLPADGVDRLVLRGSLDAEQTLSGGTAVDVSGTVLESEPGGTGFGVGFGAAYRIGGYTVGGAVGAGGLGSGDTAFSGHLELRAAF